MKVAVVFCVASCDLVYIYQHFRETFGLHEGSFPE